MIAFGSRCDKFLVGRRYFRRLRVPRNRWEPKSPVAGADARDSPLRIRRTLVEHEVPDVRLSRISTQWTIVFQAHQGSPEEVASAQAELMNRYSGAVHRYLLGSLRDVHAAEELDQEFALRFIRGDFHRADPSRGRFRDFVRKALRNLMIDYQRRRKHIPHALGDDTPEPADPASADFENDFKASWRQELMSRAWSGLKALEAKGKPYHAVLQERVKQPTMPSHQLAKILTERLGRPVDDGWVRQCLLRARARFVDILVDEVAASLPEPTLDACEEELADLDLLHYCAPAIQRRRERRRQPDA